MKKFLIISNINAACYKDVFPYIKRGEITVIGKSGMYMLINGEIGKVNTSCWLTNLEKEPPKPLELTEHYSPEKYPKFDNYDAIEVSKVKNIPMDYFEPMGVPINFLFKHNPNQFEIIGVLNDFKETDVEAGLLSGEPTLTNGRIQLFRGGVIDGKRKYLRIIIRRRK